MKYFCNTCGFIEDTDSPNYVEIEGSFCKCGADDWLEENDPVITPSGRTQPIVLINEYKGESWIETPTDKFGFGVLIYDGETAFKHNNL